MAIGAKTTLHFGMVDKSNERTRVQLHVDAIADDGSNVATVLTAVGSKAELLKAAIINMTKLNMTHTDASLRIDQSVESLPTAADAQREWATRITYVDNTTGKKYRFDVPAPVDTLVPEGTDIIPLSNLELAAFVAVFEANCVSEVGNPITVTSARIVGRRN